MPVPYGLELPFDRAPHYAAAWCECCHDFDDLKIVDGEFRCEFCRSEKHAYWHRARLRDGVIPAHPSWVKELPIESGAIGGGDDVLPRG